MNGAHQIQKLHVAIIEEYCFMQNKSIFSLVLPGISSPRVTTQPLFLPSLNVGEKLRSEAVSASGVSTSTRVELNSEKVGPIGLWLTVCRNLGVTSRVKRRQVWRNQKVAP